MTIEKRAIDLDDKMARRQEIMAAALLLFQQKDYTNIRMLDIAKSAGMAKGTLYLYFKTKEALFLEIMLNYFQEWFVRFSEILDKDTGNPESLVTAIVRTLQSYPDFLRLVTIQHSILEKNLDYDTAARFKHQLAGMVDAGGEILEQKVSSFAPGDGGRFIIFLYASIIGFKQVCEPHPFIREVMEKEHITAFNSGFSELLQDALLHYLQGKKMNKE